ncbi:condensation domain-containing protein, partial [Streptomyces sp. SID13726]|uniref:condensation domain-containing protein n=1 Tax=Streptomyces sp. SID13726 TaxID=2706058 RepID=UPI001EF183EE
MVLHAAVAATLTRFGAGSDVVVGTSVTTRDVAGWSEVAGLFLDTVLLRLRTDGDPRFGDLVLRARRADARAFAHHDAPYEKVVRLLGEEPAGPSRGVDVTIDLAPGPLAADRASLDVVPVGTARARFPLSFAFWT